MKNTEIKTLHIEKDNYTEQQWEWLVNNWEVLQRMSWYKLDQQVEEYEGEFISDIETSELVEITMDLFKSKEDYLEFKKIDDTVIENEIVDWFYSFRCENNCSGSVSKTGE